jgi:uncharacterized protein (DUF2141 family)
VYALKALPLAAAGALLATGSAAQAQTCVGPAGQARMYVNVAGVRSGAGQVTVTLYPDERRRFLARGGSLYVGRVPARAGTTRVCLNLPSTGIYGIAVYHDANGNGRIDRNMIGLPAEAYGFSNNPRGLLGIPAFSRVRLNVPRTNMQTTINLTYP